ncbi:MAG: hypothetical protein WC119_02100 [Synergistaceae bacterium]
MSISINSVDIKNEDRIDYRNILLNGKIVRSVNINQTDGYFVTTEPLENGGQIVVYPQSPNNPLYSIMVYRELGGYGTMSMPMDARFNYIKRTLWIADMGNSKALKINIGNYQFISSINEIVLPHSIIPEINLGGVFIKAFSGIHTGIVYYYASNGDLVDYCTFSCELGASSTDVQLTQSFVNLLPLANTMAYDHVRWRLWWTAESNIYMMDVRNRQVIVNKLSSIYNNTRGLDIDLSSGNAFVVVRDNKNYWRIAQVFRDNNYIIGDAYVLAEEEF